MDDTGKILGKQHGDGSNGYVSITEHP